MPAAASAVPAAPPTNCLRVRRTSGRWRSPGLDPHERAHHPIEVVKHLRVGVRRGNVFRDRVERATLTPGVEQMPLVGTLIRGVERRELRTEPLLALGVREAWAEVMYDLAVLDCRVVALGEL